MSILKEHRKKNLKNVERLMHAGFSFSRSCEICGYSKEESKSIYDKVKYIEMSSSEYSQDINEQVIVNIGVENGN